MGGNDPAAARRRRHRRHVHRPRVRAARRTLDRRKGRPRPPTTRRRSSRASPRICAEARFRAQRVREVVHATTVATNAILERRARAPALITTEGFRDVLELRRIRIPLAYDLGWQKPDAAGRARGAPSVCANGWTRRARARHRSTWTTSMRRSTSCRRRTSKRSPYASCTPIATPRHERAVGARLRERLPAVHVSLSSDVLPGDAASSSARAPRWSTPTSRRRSRATSTGCAERWPNAACARRSW